MGHAFNINKKRHTHTHRNTYKNTDTHTQTHKHIHTDTHTHRDTYTQTYTHVKAYRTVSNEALWVITGLIPININIEETAKYYESVKGQGNLFDREMEVKHWTHPANTVEITDGQEDSKHNIYVYTDGSKSEQGLGSRIAKLKQQINRRKNTN